MRTSRMGRWVARGFVIAALGLGALAATGASAAPTYSTTNDVSWTMDVSWTSAAR